MKYVEIKLFYPGLISILFYVRSDTWDDFCDFYFNNTWTNNCFLPALDKENGSHVFVDMSKVLAFSVVSIKEESSISKDPSKPKPKPKPKKSDPKKAKKKVKK